MKAARLACIAALSLTCAHVGAQDVGAGAKGATSEASPPASRPATTQAVSPGAPVRKRSSKHDASPSTAQQARAQGGAPAQPARAPGKTPTAANAQAAGRVTRAPVPQPERPAAPAWKSDPRTAKKPPESLVPIRPQALAAKPPAVGTAKPGTANLGPVDELLAAKLRNCYQEESGHELPSEDAKLLDDAKASLVKELRLDEPDPSCKSNGADASKCASRLSSMTCAELAEPIKRKGWDRHLLGADRKAIDTYMRALVKRKAGCLDKGKGGKDPVELDVEATRLGLAASMNLVTGRCQLDAKGAEPCLARLDTVACPEIEGAVAHNDLIFFCKEFLRCRKGPRLE